jgi:hypothetical protein
VNAHIVDGSRPPFSTTLMLKSASIGIGMCVDEDDDVGIPLNALEELHDFDHVLFRT